MTSSLVVATLVQLPRQHRHHHKFDDVVATDTKLDLVPHYVRYEPNNSAGWMTLDGQNVEMAEIYDQTWMEASFSEDDGADELAMVIYEDFMELISETNGCSWNAECCEKEWIGTTSRWIGATQLGMWNPAAVALRIGASPVMSFLDSVHEFLWSSTRFLLACAWTSFWTVRSLCMSWLSSWPLTSGAIFMLFTILILQKFNNKMRRKRRLRD